MFTYQRPSTICWALTVISLLGVAGCAGLNEVKHPKLAKINRQMPWYDEDLPRQGVPSRVVGNWTDTVLYQEGKIPQRGFGGKLLFYGDEGNKPILVDGQLVIYAFNEVGRAPTDNMPTRRYVFPAVELPKHMSICDLGAAYSVWLPWDDVGGPKTEVSLIARFEPKTGAVLVSEQTRHFLPGSESPESIAAAAGKPKLPEGVPFKPAVEQASWNAPVSDANSATSAAGGEGTLPTAPRTMTSTTISLPDSMRNLGPGMTGAGQVPNAAAARTLPNYRAPAAGQNQAADPSAMNQTRLTAPPTATRLDGLRSAPFSSIGRPPMGQGTPTTADQSYPPPKVIQESPQQPGATTNSVQSSTLGYNNHPLARPAANSLAPIGDSTAATVTYR